MTVDQFYFRWWTDDEGHPWVRHECLDGKVDEWRCPPPWKVVDHYDGERLAPSFHCIRCGRHTFLYATERIASPVPAQEAEPARINHAPVSCGEPGYENVCKCGEGIDAHEVPS